MNPENLTIHKLFEEAALRFPQRIALQIKKDNQWQKFTYKDLEIQALKVATFLVNEGFKKGDFAILILENRPQWPIIYLGIVYAGLTCVPLDSQLSSQELNNFILDSSSKILFCSDEIFKRKVTADIKRPLREIVVIEEDEISKISPDKQSLPSVQDQDIASLIYTSGTTGRPKGVLLTHKNICSNFKSIHKLGICFPTDNFLAILPLHHTYPFMTTLIVPLSLGATITFPPLDFRPGQLAQIIKEAKVTVLAGVPQLFSLLHSTIFEKIKCIPFLLRPFLLIFIKRKTAHNFGKHLRMMVSGGARLEPKIGQDLTRFGFKIIEGYGLTETSPVVTLNLPQSIKFGSVGKPIPEVEIKILNPDKSGTGEILIKGPNVMRGYFKQPELTSTVIKEDWFYSGDLGYIDKDGYLFISGREKEVIVLSSGKTIYPEELETYYSQSPYIKEICILQRHEERFGHFVDSLYAVVVSDLDYFRKKGEANIRAKIRWELENLAKRLPAYKHIMGFTITKEELPRTALKKIKRYQVRDKYVEMRPTKLDIEEMALSEEDKNILTQDITKKIIHYLSTQLKRPVSLDSQLEIDLGIDSLTRVELGLGLEALLSIKIPDEYLYTISTVKEMVLKISELVKRPLISKIPFQEAPKSWAQILSEAPRPEIIKKIRLEPFFLDYLLTWVFKNLFLFIFRLFWRLRIVKKARLPRQGPYIICPNHASYLDGFIVFCSLPLKSAVNTYFLGYSAIFEHPLIRWAIKLARLIPIDPNVHLTEAMQAVSFVISHKKIVCIFPEGRRSIDERIGEFKKGVGILIQELDISVVPVYIKGSHPSWPRGSRLPRFHPLKVIFGRPCLAKELIKQKKEPLWDDYEGVAQGLREEVTKLVC